MSWLTSIGVGCAAIVVITVAVFAYLAWYCDIGEDRERGGWH